MTAPTVGPLLIDSEATMPRTGNLHDEVLKDWEAAGKIASRGSRRATFWEACGSGLGAVAVSAVLITVMVVLYYETDAFASLSLPLFAVVVAVVGVAPCAVLALASARPVPLSGAPRAIEHGARKPAEGATPGETGVFRNAMVSELATTYRGASNLREVFEGVLERYGDRPAQGTRPIERKVQQTVTFTNREGKSVTRTVEKWVMAPQYSWVNYATLGELVTATGAGLLDLLPGTDEPEGPARRVGIFADSKGEWMQTALGAFRHGIPIVTVYATLGADAVAYAITQTSVSVMVVDAGLVGVVASCAAGRAVPTGNGDETFDAHCRSLTTVVVMGEGADEASVGALTARGITVLSFVDMQERGRGNPVADTPDTMPTADSIANIQYTSGSTGLPKGVVIQHRNLVAAVHGMGGSVPGLCPEDVYIAYLPLAHILELTAELCLVARGAGIGYGSKDTLVASSQRIPTPDPAAGIPVVKGDAAVLRPTAMAAVPAIMEKIRRGITAKVAAKGAVVKALFDWGVASKLSTLAAGGDSPFWNFLLFDKIRTEALGGRVRCILSGGGPLNKETQQFMNAVFCCPVGQGYGLTETMGAGTIVWPCDFTPGSVGGPVLTAELKLRDWAEGGYSTATNPPRGEVLISGPVVASQGYWQMPEKTATDFVAEADGRTWFATGDVGELSSAGVLTIIDRKKDLVKLVTGEYISLGKIESTMKLCRFITNIMAYGDGDAAAAVAVVTPDLGVVRAEFPGVASAEDAAASPAVQAAILADLKAIAKAKNFPRMETPSAILIATEDWTPESDLVTASLKLKRKNLMALYKPGLLGLYGRGPSAGAAASK